VQRSARFVGERWESFQPATVIVIVPAAKALPTLVLLETTSGQPFGRPVGGGGKADIDSQTLVASQAQLGVIVNLPQQQSPDKVQDVRLSPSGGPPGSIVLAFGTGWPAGDRIRIEPCVGSRPETCALRTDAAVFVVVDPDGRFRAAELSVPDVVLASEDTGGGFKGVQLRVPSDVRVSDYVEFYVADLSDGHHPRTFDAPWKVSDAECHDNCGVASGCHPPYCDSGGDNHGCRCLVRTDPVCSFESCDGCPKDRCAARVREEPTPTARPPSSSSTRTSSGSGQQNQAQQSGHGSGAQPLAGQGARSSTTTATTSSSGTQPTTQGQSTSTGSTSQGTQTTRTQTSGQSSSRSTQQTTQSQTTTQSSSRATSSAPPPPPPPPKQTTTSTSSSSAPPPPPPPPKQTTTSSSSSSAPPPPPPPPKQTTTSTSSSSSSAPPSKPTASPAPPPPPRGGQSQSPQPGPSGH
jgi:hypothetical protein